MKAIRWLLKLMLVMITLPLLLAVWLAKWFVVFLHHCSAWFFYLLGSVLLATAILSYLMHQSQGMELMDIQNIPFKCPHKLILLFLIFSTITIEKSQMHSSEFGGYTSSSRVF